MKSIVENTYIRIQRERYSIYRSKFGLHKINIGVTTFNSVYILYKLSLQCVLTIKNIVFPLRAVQFSRLNSKDEDNLSKIAFNCSNRFFLFELRIYIYTHNSWLQFSLKWTRIFTRDTNLIVDEIRYTLSTLYLSIPWNLKIWKFFMQMK